jgi:hypothetical protein
LHGCFYSFLFTLLMRIMLSFWSKISYQAESQWLTPVS